MGHAGHRLGAVIAGSVLDSAGITAG